MSFINSMHLPHMVMFCSCVYVQLLKLFTACFKNICCTIRVLSNVFSDMLSVAAVLSFCMHCHNIVLILML